MFFHVYTPTELAEQFLKKQQQNTDITEKKREYEFSMIRYVNILPSGMKW